MPLAQENVSGPLEEADSARDSRPGSGSQAPEGRMTGKAGQKCSDGSTIMPNTLPRENQSMSLDRREFLAASLAVSAAACQQRIAERQTAATDPEAQPGIPGPYPGRVVAVDHPGSIVAGEYQRGAVRGMIERGLNELTHAESLVDSLREFFKPGDVVGIKVNGVGRPYVISDQTVLHTLVDGLNEVGIPNRDIVVYERTKASFMGAGFDKWLPDGVRFMNATETYHRIQLDMDGYDRDVYMEMPLVHPEYAEEYRVDDPHVRRSYVCKWLSQAVDKVINICVLKHHQSAGVTLALKNMSHGFVNNVNRSHATTTANACGIFIPAVVDLPIIRDKVKLHILDGVKGAYHGGPGGKVGKYTWEHKTMYFATDPVALDKTGWKVIDEKRAEVGAPSIALLKPDEDSLWLNCQVEHIELAGNMGLGVYDDEKIRVKRVSLA